MLSIGTLKRFTPAIPINGPLQTLDLMEEHFGPHCANLHGTVAIVTDEYKAVYELSEREKTLHPDAIGKEEIKAVGIVEFPENSYPIPDMLSYCRENFPVMQNVLFVVERPPKMKGQEKILPEDEFNKMADLWKAYARSKDIPSGMRVFLSGPESHHVFDIFVVMNETTETDGAYGVKAFGMQEFIPFRDCADTPRIGLGHSAPGAMEMATAAATNPVLRAKVDDLLREIYRHLPPKDRKKIPEDLKRKLGLSDSAAVPPYSSILSMRLLPEGEGAEEDFEDVTPPKDDKKVH